MTDLTTELDQQDEQKKRQRRIIEAYEQNPRSVLTAADELEELDRETAARIASILDEALPRRRQLESKLGEQRRKLQGLLRRHLSDRELSELDRLPREASRDHRSYGHALINRVIAEELNRINREDGDQT